MSDLCEPAKQAYDEFRKEQEEKKRIERICEEAIRNFKAGVQTSLLEVPTLLRKMLGDKMDEDLKDELFLRSLEADRRNNKIISENVNAEIRRTGKISATAYANVLAKFLATENAWDNCKDRIIRAIDKRNKKK